MKKKTNKRMTKRAAVIITAVAVAIAGMTCTYAATYLKGDVDGNGSVNLNDAKLALRGALGIDKLAPDAIMRGDIDGDEKVTLKDTQQILKAALCITELGTGETSDEPDGGSDNDAPATQEPAGGNDDKNPVNKPTGTAQPSATDDAGKTEPSQTEKPAATAEPTQTQGPAHTHGWEPVYKTVHHDEVGHYETVVVKEAWDEEKLITVVICNQCGMEFSELDYNGFENALDAMTDHIFDSWDNGGDCDNYRNDVRTISTTHHPAVTEQKYVVDKAAYDEQVIDHYGCTCGAKK